MTYNDMIHCIYFGLDKGLPWTKYAETGVGESNFEYHDAEEGLYLIRDTVIGALYLVEAADPKQALAIALATVIAGAERTY